MQSMVSAISMVHFDPDEDVYHFCGIYKCVDIP